jgi:hypothetical protein
MKKNFLLLIIIISCLTIIYNCDKGNPDPSEATGNVLIKSTPNGAAIIIDGTTTTRITPDTIKNLESGTHIIKLQLTNYRDTTVSVDIENKVTKTVNIKLVSLSSPRTGEWTGVYGSAKYGLSFRIGKDGNLTDFQLTTKASGCDGTSLIEVDFSGPLVITSNDSIIFSTPSSDGTDGSWARINLRGKFSSVSGAAGLFDIYSGRGFCGSVSRGVSWSAKKDCSLKPQQGASATRFCPER